MGDGANRSVPRVCRASSPSYAGKPYGLKRTALDTVRVGWPVHGSPRLENELGTSLKHVRG